MKTDILLSAENLNEVFEIELDKIPNQTFTININEQEFKITFRTFLNNQTYMSIEKKSQSLINNVAIKTGINLIHTSDVDDVCFFFDSITEQEPEAPYSYLDFTNRIRFYYGTFS